jgi:uncharacterized membrane protein
MTLLSASPPPPRLAWLDGARGLAVIAMVVFHTAWNLSHLGFIATDVTLHPGWQAFAQAIAASFLAISGVSLALAHRDGVIGQRYWRRLGLIAGAAALVSLGTWFVFPDRFVRFGILHCMAVAGLIALPFLRRPWWWSVGATALFASGGLLAGAEAVQDHAEHSRLFVLYQHLGLTLAAPNTVDFVPLFPWAACLFGGLAAGKLWLARGGQATAQAMPVPMAGLATLGRFSLPIYLVHQPLIFGALVGLSLLMPALTGRGLERATADFRRDCFEQCRASASHERCERGCACVTEALLKDQEMTRAVIVRGEVGAAMSERLRPIIQACMRP